MNVERAINEALRAVEKAKISGRQEVLDEIQALADEGYQGAVMANMRYADGFYDGWDAFVQVLKDRINAK